MVPFGSPPSGGHCVIEWSHTVTDSRPQAVILTCLASTWRTEINNNIPSFLTVQPVRQIFTQRHADTFWMFCLTSTRGKVRFQRRKWPTVFGKRERKRANLCVRNRNLGWAEMGREEKGGAEGMSEGRKGGMTKS